MEHLWFSMEIVSIKCGGGGGGGGGGFQRITSVGAEGNKDHLAFW